MKTKNLEELKELLPEPLRVLPWVQPHIVDGCIYVREGGERVCEGDSMMVAVEVVRKSNRTGPYGERCFDHDYMEVYEVEIEDGILWQYGVDTGHTPEHVSLWFPLDQESDSKEGN